MQTFQIIAYIILGIGVLASALTMLLSRNALYSVLALVLNFVLVAVIYVMLGAPLIAFVQVTVYAGSIMILFLFVVMMLGAEKLKVSDIMPGQNPLAFVLAGVLLIEAVIMIIWKVGLVEKVVTPALEFSDPVVIGTEIFTTYVFPVLAISVLLLASTIGAIILSRGEQPAKVQANKD